MRDFFFVLLLNSVQRRAMEMVKGLEDKAYDV